MMKRENEEENEEEEEEEEEPETGSWQETGRGRKTGMGRRQKEEAERVGDRKGKIRAEKRRVRRDKRE